MKLSTRLTIAKKNSLLTYATHAEGTLSQLVASFPDIVVGGWGEPWRRYVQKLEFVLKYASSKSPEHIVIFVDTEIVR